MTGGSNGSNMMGGGVAVSAVSGLLNNGSGTGSNGTHSEPNSTSKGNSNILLPLIMK